MLSYAHTTPLPTLLKHTITDKNHPSRLFFPTSPFELPGSASLPTYTTFYAAPIPIQCRPPIWQTFTFNALGGPISILNCTITGPGAHTYFTVSSPSPTRQFTVVTNALEQPAVIIEWGRHPTVEIPRACVSKQRAREWLAISPTRGYRTMIVHGRMFVWGPDADHEYILLSSVDVGSSPRLYAKIHREDDEVSVEITVDAMQMGLLEVSVAAALLLQSGRKID